MEGRLIGAQTIKIQCEYDEIGTRTFASNDHLEASNDVSSAAIRTLALIRRRHYCKVSSRTNH